MLLNNIHEIQSIKKVKLDDTILKFANWFSSLVFYVPYILDWRGRIYPAVLYSHHHSRFARLFIHFGPSIRNAGSYLTQPLNGPPLLVGSIKDLGHLNYMLLIFMVFSYLLWKKYIGLILV